MAWSAADVPAADVTRADEDKVILVGDHVLANDGASGRWNTGGDLTAADDTNASFPVRYAYDRELDVPTKRTTAATVSYLMYDRGAGTLKDFDVALIRGNFDAITATTVELIVTDDNTDFTNTEPTQDILESWSTFTDKRLVTRDLRDSGASTNRRITDARYVALRITCSGTETPEVDEFWLGKRVQMHTRELLPYEGGRKGSSYSEFRSENRKTIRAVTAQGYEALTALFRFRDSTLASDVDTFLADIQHEGRPFLYLHEPNTDIQNAALMFADSIRYVDLGGSTTDAKELVLTMNEGAPLYSSES